MNTTTVILIVSCAIIFGLGGYFIATQKKDLQSSEDIVSTVPTAYDDEQETVEEKGSSPINLAQPNINTLATNITVSTAPVTQSNPPVSDESIDQSDSQAPIKVEVQYITQTIFQEEGYGGYEIGLDITAGEKDIFIPMTTTDSTLGATGLSYSIEGDTFRGDQESKVSCSLKTGENCKIKAGNTSTIVVTVWLTPIESGNYGVSFNKLGYGFDTTNYLQYYSVYEETEIIYLW